MSEQTRTTISLDGKIYEDALAIAAQEKRTFSNLVEVALHEFMDARSPDAADAAMVKEARDAKVDVSAVLAREIRRKKESAA